MKLISSLKALCFAVMTTVVSMSNAATTDWATVNAGITVMKALSVQRLGWFEDFYTFLLPPATFDSSVLLYPSLTVTVGEDFSQMSGFSGLAYGLYRGAGDVLLTPTFDAAIGGYRYMGLDAGSYYLKVSGEGWVDSSRLPFPSAPIYNAQVAITGGIPEPQTYVMYLVGVGALGLLVRRRSSTFF